MNLSLQDPFSVAKEFPDTLVNTLQHGHSVVIQFSHNGDYLALGLSNGAIIIYDLLSNGSILAVLHNHCRPISSISWSKCGRYILLASQDWTAVLWDLSKVCLTKTSGGTSPESGHEAAIRRIKFDGPIWQAQLLPLSPFQFTAALFDDSPVAVDISKSTPQITKLPTTALNEPDSKDKHVTLVTTFTPSGSHVFTGTSKGWINVFSPTWELVRSFKIANSNIKTLVVSPNGRKLAVNSSDRIIRQINLPDLVNDPPEEWEFEVQHRYQDVVNRLQWNMVLFNHNAEFLVASTFGQSSQDLYLWETSLGSLIKILEGSPEELIDVKWNYSRCMIGSTGLDSGTVYLWLVQFPQKWSALAPDFVEIEENIEYEEKEDEFDIVDDDDLIKKQLEEEDQQIDIITPEPTDARGFSRTEPAFVIPIDYLATV